MARTSGDVGGVECEDDRVDTGDSNDVATSNTREPAIAEFKFVSVKGAMRRPSHDVGEIKRSHVVPALPSRTTAKLVDACGERTGHALNHGEPFHHAHIPRAS
jgi:hypothetical protein